MILAGLLGESMRESVHAASGYIRSKADRLGVNTKLLAETDLHVHVPAGAVPKDGPSAGVAIAASLVSLLNEKPVRGDVAMTGEVTLTGRVLPVGGIREKVLAARRAGIHHVLLPIQNQKDLVDLPKEVKADMSFDFVESIDDVISQLFPKEPVKKPTRKLGQRSQPASQPPG